MNTVKVAPDRDGLPPPQDAVLPAQDAAQVRFLVSVAVAVLVVLLLVIWKVFQARKSSRRAVLLVGLCDSGKTLLFVRLLTGHFRNTQTSITDSSALYRIKNDKNRNVTLIDLPGHESLRLQFLDRFKAAASNQFSEAWVVKKHDFKLHAAGPGYLRNSLIPLTTFVPSGQAGGAH